jgi:hypothetical protein
MQVMARFYIQWMQCCIKMPQQRTTGRRICRI